MVKYLSRLKHRKGFTIVELVVVVAIIAVLIAMIMGSLLDNNTEKFMAANANAEAFFTSTQLIMTKAQFTETSYVVYDSADIKYIKYENGVNTTYNGTTENCYLFIEAKANGTGFEYVSIKSTLKDLMFEVESSCASSITALEKRLMTQYEGNLTDSYEGYFYAVIDSNFKVLCTHYSDYRLPEYSSETASEYATMLMYQGDGKIDGRIVGTCRDGVVLGASGEYAFNCSGMGSDFFGVA